MKLNSRSTISSVRSVTIRTVFAMLLGTALFGCEAATTSSEAPSPSSRAAGTGPAQIVALVPDERASQSVLRAAKTEGYQSRGTTDLKGLGLKMLTFDLPQAVTGQQAIVTLEAAEPASTVGINETYRLQKLPEAVRRFAYANDLLSWPTGGCEALAPVGLIDSGVDSASVGLPPSKLISRRFAAGEATDLRHGTEIATILADPALLRNVTIYSADVVGQTENGGQGAHADALVRAMDWMASEDVRVINLSLAGPYNKILNLAVYAAAARGLTMVAAAGNDGPQAEPRYPAGFEPVIAVTAVDSSRQIYSGAVNGLHIDIAAPGVDVFIPSGDSGRFATGTSIAAPFVTARILADSRLLSSPSVEILRDRLALQAEDLGLPGADRIFGAGLLKANGMCTG